MIWCGLILQVSTKMDRIWTNIGRQQGSAPECFQETSQVVIAIHDVLKTGIHPVYRLLKMHAVLKISDLMIWMK